MSTIFSTLLSVFSVSRNEKSFPLNCSITKQREEFEDKQIKEQFGSGAGPGREGENNEPRLSQGEGKKVSRLIHAKKSIGITLG